MIPFTHATGIQGWGGLSLPPSTSDIPDNEKVVPASPSACSPAIIIDRFFL
jgi:hypothetical protein